ncbi:Peptide deformylase [Rickettsiales bacterium Ac37b]|nr:Peptide deformylase [Rickettsiales bacterium Ac37b]
MAILALVLAPDPRLKQKSLPVEKVDDDLRKFMDDMLETMYYSEGAGLAAIQVGIAKRILIVDVSNKENDEAKNPIFMVNPEIIYISEEKCIRQEGCLSIPTQILDIERPSNIKVKYLDYNGNTQELEADGWLATAIQHEMDHLNGVLLLDHASLVKRDTMIRKAKKIKKTYLSSEQ